MGCSDQNNMASIDIDERGRAIIHLDGGRLNLNTLDAALGRRLCLQIAAPIWQRIGDCCDVVAEIAKGDAAAYGINTGFGQLCNRRIPPADVETLQKNLIISHSVGVGDPVPDEIVRWMMLFKVHALTHGVSGVAPRTIECVKKMLDHDVLPIIPSQGSLGASGDLAPLAHMVRPLIGLGSVRIEGQTEPAIDVFRRLEITPIRLGPKEGLALINGTQFISAHAAAILVRAIRLAKHADIIATMSLEGICGSITPFDERLHNLRPHPGAIEVADNVRRLMKGSQILASHAECDRVQDPYSVRCVPQVHGASRDAIRHAAHATEIEINSVTDNPLIFDGTVISGGNFHGQPLAMVLDYLAIALAEFASISERRVYLLLSGANDLPTLLMKNTGLNSGFMISQYTAAALVSENKILCGPASVDSIPTSLGQEDHVSMGATAASKCLRVLNNTETVLAIEQMCAAQAMDFRDPMAPGVGPGIARDEIRKAISHAEEDRLFGDDITASLALLRSRRILKAVEAEIGQIA